MIITGQAAIDHAESQNLTLNKYADPIEEARAGLTVEEAEEVAREDASLIWINVQGAEAEAKEWAVEIVEMMSAEDVASFDDNRAEWADGISTMVFPEALPPVAEAVDLVMASIDEVVAEMI